jgi:hypothetical protein
MAKYVAHTRVLGELTAVKGFSGSIFDNHLQQFSARKKLCQIIPEITKDDLASPNFRYT